VSDELTNRVRAAAAASELVRTIASVRRDGGQELALGDAVLRPLYGDEIDQLETLGNLADDWSRVRVADGFDWRKVRHCSFHGDVLLGRFVCTVRLAEGLEVSAGLWHATLANCVIGHDTLLRDVKLLANYVVAQGVLILDCGVVSCDGRTAFGNGKELALGIESGGREVAVYAEIDVEVAATVARSRGRRDLLNRYTSAVADYTAQVVSSRGIVGPGAVLRSTPKLHNSYIGSHALIDGATLVSDSTVLSNAEEPARVESGACVTGSLLQWGSRVATAAVVERSVLTEHSHAERHATVTSSILGPNTGVAGGEVVSCLLGPFVSFHHQALLIATLWPEGKGNVSYGANAGANHTSRAPDQEFWPGEGAFLGLGVNIKFPADLSGAPYTVLAAGVTTLPQKIRFPFSLVNMPSRHYAGVSPVFNEIIPAWLLTHSLYTLKRNEGKYLARNQARRAQFEFKILRPDIVELMRDACRRLEAVSQVQELYTDRDIEGLGKNYLLETYRAPAIEAYRFFARYYALLGLKERLESALRDGADGDFRSILETPSIEPRWEHTRILLWEELGIDDAIVGLRQLTDMLEKIANDVERSKAKDDERGVRIVNDYAEVHVEAAQDPFVRQTWAETRRLQREVQELIHRLQGCSTNWESARPAHPPAKQMATGSDRG
jgi:hypothetical protein